MRQKIFHVLQGPDVLLCFLTSDLVGATCDVLVDRDDMYIRECHTEWAGGWRVSGGAPAPRNGIMVMFWGLWGAGGG